MKQLLNNFEVFIRFNYYCSALLLYRALRARRWEPPGFSRW